MTNPSVYYWVIKHIISNLFTENNGFIFKTFILVTINLDKSYLDNENNKFFENQIIRVNAAFD